MVVVTNKKGVGWMDMNQFKERGEEHSCEGKYLSMRCCVIDKVYIL